MQCHPQPWKVHGNGTPAESDEPLWGEFWKKEELLSVKASLPVSKWNAQWMQNPTAESGSIVKREWWQKWEKDDIPACHTVIQSYDTAFSKKETADYSAITTWGIFDPEDGTEQAIILLDANRYRVDFPELKKIALFLCNLTHQAEDKIK
jgi:phage terminase large subunit-like protein